MVRKPAANPEKQAFNPPHNNRNTGSITQDPSTITRSDWA
jgi:hypothetical protein